MIINGSEVSKDNLGRFSMKDVHIASGERESRNPSVFLRQRAAHNAVMFFGGDEVKAKGVRGSVYCSYEIVLLYAAWLSPQVFSQVLAQNAKSADVNAINEMRKLIDKLEV